MGTRATAPVLSVVPKSETPPDATLTLALPVEAVIAAIEQSPSLLDQLATRVAALVQSQQEGLREARASEELPERMTAAQAALYLNCSVSHIYELTYRGQLIVIKSGRSKRSRSLYERVELDRYLNLDDYSRRVARRERYEQELVELSCAH